ncbi:protein SSUH2-like protein [Dinothrombium tinctorium]|uniref:Protein SSUH2-like protein n=1 Tax=Dinothrombium tinctorium TaxID=1965070 RepID=A0A3S3Q4M9_9ACAR|nr:protein SSUH2-like protein [Dinothrombium tinctorium]RWS13947.1 protein SSUH2-like protein [Dinothrombium tinctorium]RWS15428.1 protein SSUH2-like protein [Dinothrombium tinctorium]
MERPLAQSVGICEDEVKEALAKFVDDHCCYGKGPLNEIIIEDITMKSSFKYTLESFTERRKTAWNYQPYDGVFMNMPPSGVAPGPWDVAVSPPKMFEKCKQKIEVPNTSVIKYCHKCTGKGKLRCTMCNGDGGSRCTFCDGTGNRETGSCFHCSGTGFKRCLTCQGHGHVKCNTCKGFKMLRCFIELNVHWTNHVDQFVSDETGLSESLIQSASGAVVVDERYPRVYPLLQFYDMRIQNASKELVEKHATSFPNERILEQRQRVIMIPVAVVHYKHRESSGFFFVYGTEHKVCFDDYPAKCCCGCTIL